ncbi:dTDP-4-dehydrorhamnose 3,5-epimerase [Caldicellulosiruptor changbaiensis]|uniref:dTDP-4-dehydrorhamnose 3,5-epimerase n=1 Tax=Caldicellulosiruptor changbaiensis TaxID=1222016 RepID=A0A3T0D8Q8_9FIRM|nr:dTDP-4-dehydrorhamnose 3,5-epimerase [Caldicellulosiruptor changbaiensis]AZT91537.1 dTDP-4-dehydrorhamnose 3,5-epimerase [Caldicellulosiruptor changbaiensis]
MAKFKKIETPIKDLFIIEPTIFEDNRGFFMESWNEKEFNEIGLKIKFVQDNHSRSKKGVLRGLHFQEPYPQGKLVRVIRGAIFDVAVDIREDSPTFKKWFGIVLDEHNRRMLYIPEGFLHGFLTLSEWADVLYKTTEYYYKEYDRGIIWNDPDLKIEWPFEEYGIDKVILSEKDSQLPTFKQWLKMKKERRKL